jgi:2-polyprenyl-3-methyl-5-hydroxy-6-metoxy-1,4-benzoquinol methylase
VKVLELVQCPACGSDRLETFEIGGGHLLRRCIACETVSAQTYVDPAEVYVDGYMFGDAGAFGIDAQNPVFQQYLARVATRRVKIVERAARMQDGAWLDVGAGGGEVLVAARARGWTCAGVEPERTGAELARRRGLDVRTTLLEDSGLPEQSFDVVSAFHVLEHLPESRAFLRSLARWARPGGFVVVEVPNWRALPRRRLRERWSALRPGEHLVHFTPQTLRRTVIAAGLEPVLVRSPTYVGEPQNLGHALSDLGRDGRLRRVLERLSVLRETGGVSARYPTRAGWLLLRGVETIHDRAGVGSVVLCIAAAR